MIRPAHMSDIPQIFSVRNSARENYMSVIELLRRAFKRKSIVTALQSGTLGVWVKEEGGKIAGFSMADKSDGHIFAVFTRPGFEKTGHGSALLHACENWLRQHGQRRAKLETERNTAAYQFYLKRGWREAGRLADDNKSVVLEKPL